MHKQNTIQVKQQNENMYNHIKKKGLEAKASIKQMMVKFHFCAQIYSAYTGISHH